MLSKVDQVQFCAASSPSSQIAYAQYFNDVLVYVEAKGEGEG